MNRQKVRELSEHIAPLLLGTAAGMRSTLPLFAVAVTGRRPGWAGVALAVASLLELVYDKLPGAGDRTQPPALGARLVSGALAGGITARRRGQAPTASAVAGALSAVASTFVFHRLRARAAARLPRLAAALGEDGLAVALTALGARAPR